MKRFIALFTAVILVLCASAPVLAAGLAISPPSVEFDVPAGGSTEVEFLVYDFTGDLEISLEDIPLRVEPTTVPVTTKEGGTEVVLTFYGDESLDSQVFNGKIRFLAMTGGTVAMGIKVKATVNHIASGQPLPEETLAPPEEAAIEQAPSEESPPPGSPPAAPEEAPAPSGTTELPVLLLAGIAAGTAIVITLIVVLARRPKH